MERTRGTGWMVVAAACLLAAPRLAFCEDVFSNAGGEARAILGRFRAENKAAAAPLKDGPAAAPVMIVQRIPERQWYPIEIKVGFTLDPTAYTMAEDVQILSNPRGAIQDHLRKNGCPLCYVQLQDHRLHGTVTLLSQENAGQASYIEIRHREGPAVEGLVWIDAGPVRKILGRTFAIPGDPVDVRLKFNDDFTINEKIELKDEELPFSARANSGSGPKITHKENLHFESKGTLTLSESAGGASLSDLLRPLSISVGPLVISPTGVRLWPGLGLGAGPLRVSAGYGITLYQFEEPEETPAGGVLVQLDYQPASVGDGATSTPVMHHLLAARLGAEKEEREFQLPGKSCKGPEDWESREPGLAIVQEKTEEVAAFPGEPAALCQRWSTLHYEREVSYSKSALLINRVAHLSVLVNLHLSRSDLDSGDNLARLSFQAWPEIKQ